jgi:hypothetical protein
VPIIRELDASENLQWVIPSPEEEARSGGSRITACVPFREGNLTFRYVPEIHSQAERLITHISYSGRSESLLIGCVTESPLQNHEDIIEELKKVLFEAFPTCKVEQATD